KAQRTGIDFQCFYSTKTAQRRRVKDGTGCLIGTVKNGDQLDLQALFSCFFGAALQGKQSRTKKWCFPMHIQYDTNVAIQLDSPHIARLWLDRYHRHPMPDRGK